MRSGIVLVFLTIISLAGLQGQVNKFGVPLHSSYSVELSGGTEYNHCMTKDRNGVVYIGNDGRGVIRFDGTNWSLIPVRNKPTLYAIQSDSQNIVYVGGTYEFGYLSPAANGNMEYHSLAQKIDTVINVRTVYSILVQDDRVLFSASRGVFTYFPANDSLTFFSVMESGFRNLLTMVQSGNRMFVSDNLSGILEFTGDTIKQTPGGTFFSMMPVTVLIPLNNEELLVGTLANGLYIYNFNTGVISDSFVSPELNERLKQAQVYRGIKMSDNRFALGTRTREEGVMVFDRDGTLTAQYTTDVVGMDNNLVTSLYSDPEQNSELWIGTVGFFTKVYTNLPFTYFSKSFGISSGVNAITEFNNTVYIGHDNGVSRLVSGNIGFPVFSGLPEFTDATPALSIFEYGDESFLIAGTQSGAYFIDKNNVVRSVEESFRSGDSNKRDVRIITQSRLNRDKVYFGVANSIFFVRYLGNFRWEDLGKYPIQGHVNEILESEDGSLWFSTIAQKSIYKLEISGSDSVLTVYDQTRGLPVATGLKIRFMGNDLLAMTSGGIFRYDIKTDSFINANDLFDGFASDREFSVLYEDGDGSMWVSYKEGGNEGDRYLEAVIPKESKRDAYITKPFYALPIAPTYDIAAIDGRIWLAKSKNVFVVDKESLLNQQPFKPFLNKIVLDDDSVYMTQSFTAVDDNGRRYPVLSQNTSEQVRFIYSLNNIRFYWSSDFMVNEEKTKYSFKLEGNDEKWSEWESLLYKDFSNLRYGQYTFRLKARSVTGLESEEAVFEFVILKPWYARFLAIVFYVLATTGIILTLVKIYTKRLINENLRLEGIVAERTAEVVRQKDELESSIHYASRIQRALLPSEKILSENINDYFVLFKPRDIVSGDFYWMTRRADKLFIVAADCTGHGVPGAFMSLLGMSFLDEIVNKSDIQRADLILRELRAHVTNSLKQVGDDDEAKDGMDIALLMIDFNAGRIEFSGAYNPCFKVRRLTDRELKESGSGKQELSEGVMTNGRYLLETVFASKMPIGISARMDEDFLLHQWNIEKGTSYYLFSDGYVDQFGSNGRKFMKKNFKKLLLDIQEYPMSKQKEILEETLKQWMGDTIQIDDILVIGLRTD